MPENDSVWYAWNCGYVGGSDDSAICCSPDVANLVVWECETADDLESMSTYSQERAKMHLTERTPSAPTSRSTRSVKPSSNFSSNLPEGCSSIVIKRLFSQR